MKRELKNPGAVHFSGPILDPGGSGAYVEFPFSTVELYGSSGRIPVIVDFEGVNYRGSMVRMGTEKHIIIVVKSIRALLNKTVGDSINVIVKLDDKPRKVELPADVKEVLEANVQAVEIFDRLAYSHQREYILWIDGAKRAETRQRRIAGMITKLIDKKT